MHKVQDLIPKQDIELWASLPSTPNQKKEKAEGGSLKRC